MSLSHATQDSPFEGSTDQPDQAERLATLWREIQTVLYERVQHEQFETWFRRAHLRELDHERATLAVHNLFSCQFIQEHYSERLLEVIEEVVGSRREVRIVVDTSLPNMLLEQQRVDAASLPGALPAASTRTTSPTRAESDRARPVSDQALPHSVTGPPNHRGLSLNPNYRFDSFVVGPCNNFAYAAAVGVSESPGRNYNPFFLYGSVGLGKTHLMQSLCSSIFQRNPQTKILYLSCETFVNHFIQALGNGNLQEFRDKYRNVDVLVVDDIHLLGNKERSQDEFFHTFNTLYLAGKQIVLSSDSPPRDIPSLQERLVSRFRSGLVTEMESPAYETRMAILKRKTQDRGQELPDDVARLLAERIDSNIRELEGAVNSLLGFASVTGQPISEAVARQCLRELFETGAAETGIEDILRVVTQHYSVKHQDLQSRKRTSGIAFARQVGMYLARRLTRHSLEEIGGYFGGRDHSTVLYGVTKITKLAQSDATVLELLRKFEIQLRPRA